jgi:hypothetical protein
MDWCGWGDLNSHEPCGPADFKSAAYADSATAAPGLYAAKRIACRSHRAHGSHRGKAPKSKFKTPTRPKIREEWHPKFMEAWSRTKSVGPKPRYPAPPAPRIVPPKILGYDVRI